MADLPVDELRPALAAALTASAGKHLDELRRLVEMPSISAQGQGIDECAKTVASLLAERGFDVEIRPTEGNPVVCAWGGASQGAPTLLFYEHYDVQPPEPLDLWTVPPFELTERDGKYFGRGSADTKGHIMCRIAAIDAVREVLGSDPVRYVFLVEGEEEIGSPNLEAFIGSHADDFRADGCLWEFGGVDSDGTPGVTLGLKGIQSLELRAKVPAYDAHSSLGAVIDNPLYRISKAVASLRDDVGRVLIEGFYDDVRPLTPSEVAAIEAEPDRTAELAHEYEIEHFLGGAYGTELQRRLQAEPCVNVNGIHGGYGGAGTKTVLPSEAFCKLDFRLVPNQQPHRVVELLRVHLDRIGLDDVEIVPQAGEGPGRTALDDPFVALVADAARLAYGREPVVHVSTPGTGPAAPFAAVLRVPFTTAGCAYPGSRAHAPDEHIRIADFETGKLHTALVIAAMGQASR
jgi:acetylornithine deacetylase/succinyl-diaminopimelate desuccinylase-like protein